MIYFKYVTIVLVSLSLFGCISLNKKKKPQVVIEEVDESGNVIKKENEESHYKKCAMDTLPDAILGGGILVMISNPLAPVVAAGYYGGKYYYCYRDMKTRQKPLDLTDLVDEARRKTAEEIKADFENVKNRLETRTKNVNETLDGIEMRIKEIGEIERNSIRKTGSKVLKDVYEQLDVIRNSEIQMKNTVTEEYVPLFDDDLIE